MPGTLISFQLGGGISDDTLIIFEIGIEKDLLKAKILSTIVKSTAIEPSDTLTFIMITAQNVAKKFAAFLIVASPLSPVCFYWAELFSAAMAEINIFKCDACGREFELDYQLEMHAQYIHKSPSAYKCETCGQEFGMKEQLEMHATKYTHDASDKSKSDWRGNRTAEPSRKLY